jgi:tRNA G10  N-methylase Trm11
METNKETELELIKTNLKRYTFESPKIKKWVEENSKGKVLNLFAGKTKLNLDEVRNDIDKTMLADYYKDAVDFVKEWKGEKFDTIILDPPYAYRKSMEMYNGNKASRFRMLADLIPTVLKENGIVIVFGYHSTFLSKKRNATLKKLCVFAHGGSQHCTIGIIEQLNNGNDGISPKHKGQSI